MATPFYIPYYKGGATDSSPSPELKAACYGNVVSFETMSQITTKEGIPLYVGGDQTITLFTLQNTMKRHGSDIFVFYLDSHADINDHDTSPSGNKHGMVLNPKVRMEHGLYYISLRQVVFYGLKDVDPEEMKRLLQLNPEMHSLLNMPYTVPDRAKVHLAIDLDCMKLDQGVSYPFNSGYSLIDILSFIDRIERRYNIVSAEFVEYIPDLDPDKKVLNEIVLPIVERLKHL